MNNDKKISVAIRKKDGTIGTYSKNIKSLTNKGRIYNLFIIRGIIGFIEGSFKQFYAEELMKKIEGNKKSYNHKTNKKSNDKTSSGLLVFLIIAFGILLYFITPTIISYFLKEYFSLYLILGGVEILLRLAIFLLFFISFSLVERKNETARYHGAEHKTLYAYYDNSDLTIQNKKKYSIRHPSCGTSLLFLTIIVSIPFFIWLNYENMILRIAVILLLLPMIMGISFEIVLWLEKSSSKIAKFVAIPGLFLQRFNTKEPSNSHIEVALASIKELFNQ